MLGGRVLLLELNELEVMLVASLSGSVELEEWLLELSHVRDWLAIVHICIN